MCGSQWQWCKKHHGVHRLHDTKRCSVTFGARGKDNNEQGTKRMIQAEVPARRVLKVLNTQTKIKAKSGLRLSVSGESIRKGKGPEKLGGGKGYIYVWDECKLPRSPPRRGVTSGRQVV